MKNIMLRVKVPTITKAIEIMNKAGVTQAKTSSKTARCFTVIGNRKASYNVYIDSDGNAKCNCSYFKQKRKICKHIVAAHFYLNPDIYEEAKAKFDLNPFCDKLVDSVSIANNIVDSLSYYERDNMLRYYILGEYDFEKSIYTLQNLISEIRESVDISQDEILEKLNTLIPIEEKPTMLSFNGEYGRYDLNLSDGVISKKSIIPMSVFNESRKSEEHFIPADVIISAIDEDLKKNKMVECVSPCSYDCIY